MDRDKPLKDQMTFLLDRARSWTPPDPSKPADAVEVGVHTPRPECIACWCRILRSGWSKATEYKRRTGYNFYREGGREGDSVEVKVVSLKWLFSKNQHGGRTDGDDS